MSARQQTESALAIAPAGAAAGDQGRERSTSPEPPFQLRPALVSGLGWVTGARVIGGIGAIIRYVIFARLLKPFDFGVVGAATFCEMLFRTITSPNFDRAVVPQREEVESYLDTVWLTALAQAVAVGLALLLTARPLAAFFQIHDFHRVFWAMTPLTVLITLKSPASTGRIYRNLDFHISLALNAAEVTASFLVGLAGILWWRDWRGLVIAMYAGAAARSALTYWYYPYRPRLSFDLWRARKMFAFGRWLTVREIADFAAQNLDNLAVGHLLGAQALGEYQMAFRLGELPAAEVGLSTGIVSFPLVARLRGRRATHQRLFVLANCAVALVGVAYAVFAFEWGSLLISTTVGTKWLGALRPYKLLCLYGLFRGMLNVGTGFLDGLSAPRSSFRLTLINALFLAVFIYPLTLLFGTAGAALAVVISVALPLPEMFRLYRNASKAIE